MPMSSSRTDTRMVLSQDESMKLMASYFSDMAEIDEQYLEDFNNMSLRRVGGLDVNALIGRKYI